MPVTNDIHHQFATFFKSYSFQPFAYLVSKKLSEGHICLELDQLETEREELPPIYRTSDLDRSVLHTIPLVSEEGKAKQPFILHGGRLYMQRYFNYESMILRRIEALIASERSEVSGRAARLLSRKEYISSLFPAQPGNGPDWQLAAAISAFVSNFCIITGGPGTGKTTTVAKILALLFTENPSLKVALAAPTGKAAARMTESLRAAGASFGAEIKTNFAALEPSTIHRLLKPVKDSPYFKFNASNPLRFDVLIVDESSMIDVALFAKLLDAVGDHTKVIFLGDKDQLASVEAGSLFGDICKVLGQLNLFDEERRSLINSFVDDPADHIPAQMGGQDESHPLFQHIIELRYSHRFNSEEGIGKMSRAVIENNAGAIKDFYTTKPDPRIITDISHSQDVFEDFATGYKAYIREPDISLALDKLNAQRILCAIREGENGLYATNRRVESFLASRKLIKTSMEFYENRPIIITSNNYALGLYNGDIGIIRPDQNGVLKAWFKDSEGGLLGVLPGLIGNTETVYAMTIHKSQGSEFSKVMLILPEGNISLLTRELLYTGITRAREQVVISGSLEVVLTAAEAKVQRASGISGRFNRRED